MQSNEAIDNCNSIFDSFLAMKPGFDFIALKYKAQQNCCGSSCFQITKKTPSPHSKKQNDCNEKTCNPFQVCGSCALVCDNLYIFGIPKMFRQTEELNMFNADFISQFESDIWQPPKTI